MPKEEESSIPGIASANLSTINAIYSETQSSLAALLLAGGLDPASALCDADLRGWNFSNVDVRGVNFTNSNLTGTRIEEAYRDETTILTGSKVKDTSANDLEDDALASVHRSYEALSNLYVVVTSGQSVLEHWIRHRNRSLASILQVLLDATASTLENSFRFRTGSKWSIVIYQFDRELSTLRAAAALRSLPASSNSYRNWPPGEGIVGLTFQKNREIVVPDIVAPELGSLFKDIERDIEFADRSSVTMPIQTDNRVWGVISVTSDVPRHFDTDSEGFQNIEPIRALTSTIALAVAISEATETLSQPNVSDLSDR
jgi:uncharacterized protein YjbI with pentapeptide repeats